MFSADGAVYADASICLDMSFPMRADFVNGDARQTCGRELAGCGRVKFARQDSSHGRILEQAHAALSIIKQLPRGKAVRSGLG